jgi:hypothetical protein
VGSNPTLSARCDGEQKRYSYVVDEDAEIFLEALADTPRGAVPMPAIGEPLMPDG